MLEMLTYKTIDLTKNGKCKSCGNCCSNLLPMTKAEVETIKQYIKKYHIKEQKHCFPEIAIADLTCPFLDMSKGKDKCVIYEVRPQICRSFVCNKTQSDIFADKEFQKHTLDMDAVNVRDTFFTKNKKKGKVRY